MVTRMTSSGGNGVIWPNTRNPMPIVAIAIGRVRIRARTTRRRSQPKGASRAPWTDTSVENPASHIAAAMSKIARSPAYVANPVGTTRRAAAIVVISTATFDARSPKPLTLSATITARREGLALVMPSSLLAGHPADR